MSTPSGHQFVRPEIRQLPGIRAFQVDPALHRLQWNENPFDFPADLKEEVLQRLARVAWSRYPLGLRPYGVIDAIAAAMGLSSSQIVAGNGSSDILRVVISAILGPGDHAITLAPTFGAYVTHARQAGATVHTLPLRADNGFALPVDAILATAAEQRAKLITVCAPNNPTGTPYSVEQLRQIVRESNAFVLLDAAYAEFSGQDLRPLLSEADNLAIVHTFSKAYALAGVRVGYAMAAAEVAQEFQKLITNFTLSPFSEIAIFVALENRARFQPMIDQIVAERARLARELARLPGVTVFPSATNFLLVHVGHSGKALQEYLRTNHALLISEMGMYPGYEDYVRISIGSPAENDTVVTATARYLASVAA